LCLILWGFLAVVLQSSAMPNHDDTRAVTKLVRRIQTLLLALQDGPLARPELLQRIADAYPSGDSARRTLDRDLTYLAQWGIVVERSRTRPPVYTLRGGTLAFSDGELRALALIRDTFGAHHPQGEQVQALLARLSDGLTAAARAQYEQRQVLRAPVQPAIDYTPHVALLARLQEAISRQLVIAFRYGAAGARSVLHRNVEPYEIEYYERHFYLVACSHDSGQVHDFRIDRIDAVSVEVLHGGSFAHATRPLITFRYRLAAVVARGGISQRFEQQRVVEQLPNGDVIIEAQGRSDFFIRRTLLKYAHNAELLWPPWLRAQLAEEIQALAKLYGSSE
jgi:predicted DNA-binding transcriptional regulator YafY